MAKIDDFGIKSEFDEMVVDPGRDEIVFIDKMKEKELLDLLVRLALKAKSIKSRHSLRHGYLLNMGRVLEKLYYMNIHRWGLDQGKSEEELEAFEKYFKDKLFGDFHKTNQLILELMRKQIERKDKNSGK